MRYNENVLKRVRRLEEKNGVTYAKEDGRLYKTLRVCYGIVLLYAVGIQLLYLIGMLMMHFGTDRFPGIIEPIVTVAVCTVLILAGFILLFFRWKTAAGVLSVLPEGILIYVFGSILRDETGLGLWGFRVVYFWRHLIPLVLLMLFMTAMTVISVRARRKTEKQYRKVLENLYALYHVGEADELSEEQWEEFLEAYDPNDYKKLYKQNWQTEEE